MQSKKTKSFWHVNGYSDYENMFEFLVNLEYFTVKKLNLLFKK